MRVLVSDASVLIDLARWSLIGPAFRLPYEFVIPDVLFEDELIDLGEVTREDLLANGLKVESLGPEGVARAMEYVKRHARLSLNDGFAVSLAVARGYGLLTGDTVLRKVAESEKVDVHGVLWVLDRMGEDDPGLLPTLVEVLKGMLVDPRTRLPAHEVRKRIDHWKEARTR